MTDPSHVETYIGSRLLYDGDESTVHVIDDSTEEL